MTREEQDRAAVRRKGLVPVLFNPARGRPCPGGPGEVCVQQLCRDCAAFSTAPSIHTPMQPAARLNGDDWVCVDFHAATVGGCEETRKSATCGGVQMPSSAMAGLGF